jgi:hypothetical protein
VGKEERIHNCEATHLERGCESSFVKIDCGAGSDDGSAIQSVDG